MRLILKGKAPKLPDLRDLWIAYFQSDVFLASQFFTQGYNRLDAYIVAGGGGGGGGGQSYYVPNGAASGSGGGGGGGGQLRRALGLDLLAMQTTIQYDIGKGGKGGSADPGDHRGTVGGDSNFNGYIAKGGDYGGGGIDAIPNTPVGGAGGGGGGPVQTQKTLWTPSAPNTKAKGSVGREGSGSGGDGALPGTSATRGGNGSAYTSGGGYYNVFGGGGGGGGGVGFAGTYSEVAENSKGGGGGRGYLSLESNWGLISIIVPVDTFWVAGGGGGSAGSGHDLTKLSHLPGLSGLPYSGIDFYAPDNDDPSKGKPGAGGHGGYGGYSLNSQAPGAAGVPGSDGCLLVRVYRENT